ncbi:hypothetical protein [Paractinoplanes globisporus]|uniref:G domain-containing protein n=1 Tax=Paractinoplanes globisporus TaxID=113565 RepID=A0ABW6WG25_9ACTN|nr:hypothetical protein [Actinoplanes globisporus]
MTDVERRAEDLLDRAALAFRGHSRAENWLRRHRERLGEPLRVAVTGGPQSGKSTLVNALIGEDVAPVRANGGSVWYHDGAQPLARVFPEGAPPFTVPLERDAPHGHAVAAPADGIRSVVVEWPCRALRHTRLLETAAAVPGEADAVLHLVRHLGDDELAPLREGAAHPVHTLVLLSRADETAGGRTDALLTAKRIARRRRTEPRIGALCQDVLAISARIAHAGRTLREEEYATVAAIAGLHRTEAEAHLLSADRFTGAAFAPSIPAGRRAALLDRLGLGGVRLAVTLARTTARSRAALGEQLVRQSGLTELQASISDLLTARRGVLKARVALVALEHLLRAENHPAAGHLAAEAELLMAGAHELRELRLLAALRTGRVALPADLALEARRLIGGDGGAHCERLGLDPQTPPEKLWPAAESAAVRWHEQTTVAATAGGRRAAEVVLRSCTAILDALG